MERNPALGQQLGRYVLYDEIAAGGMATVHFGRMLGPAGFSRTVAIKRLHPHLARDPQFVSMFLDEARVAARVQHPNVVSTIDVVAREGELFLVMEYINGESLSNLLREARASGTRVPPRVVSSVVSGVLYGLHAAHEAKSEQGEALQIVHRDISPQNIIVGIDGIARVVNFGVAKATMRVQWTRSGEVKGKFSYMAPEQLESRTIDRRTDIYATAVVLWEALASRRLFVGDDPGSIVTSVLLAKVPTLTAIAPDLPAGLAALVQRGLARDANDRFPTAQAMALELEKWLPAAPPHTVGEWVANSAPERLQERSQRLARIERTPAEAHVALDGDSGLLLSPAVIRSLSEAHTQRATTPLAAAADLRADGEAPAAVSGITELSLVSEPRARVRRARRNRLFITAGVVGMAAAGVSYLRVRHSAKVEPSHLASVVAPAYGLTAQVPLGSSAAPIESAVPVVESAVPVVTKPIAAATGGAAAKTTHRVAAGKTVKSCDPPYTIDAAGVKRFKQWCFK